MFRNQQTNMQSVTYTCNLPLEPHVNLRGKINIGKMTFAFVLYHIKYIFLSVIP